MSKYIHKFLLHSIAFIFLLLSSSLYAGEPPPTSKLTKADYNKLCDFYKEITNKYNNKPVAISTREVDIRTREGELIDTIDSKLPDLLNELYVHAMLANPEERYNLIKEYAKQINNITWECKAAKLFYINTYKKTNNADTDT